MNNITLQNISRIAELIELGSTKTDIAEYLGITRQTLERHLKLNGFNFKLRPDTLTKDEKHIIVENYSNLHPIKIMDLLPGRSWDLIKRHASKMKIKKSTKFRKDVYTKEEIELLKTEYTNCSSEHIRQAFPNRNYKSLRSKAESLNISRFKKMDFSQEEVDILRANWDKLPKKDILKLMEKCNISRDWTEYEAKAQKLNLYRNCKEVYKSKSNLFKLLEENCTAYYWMGFGLADFYFSNRKISVTLSNKDFDHLVKLTEFIEVQDPCIRVRSRKTGFKNHHKFTTSCVTTFSGKDAIIKLKNKFDIKNQKSFNPPDYDLAYKTFSDKHLVSLLIGLIDGDGWITYTSNKNTRLGLCGPIEWKSFFIKLTDQVSNYLSCKSPRFYERYRENRKPMVDMQINSQKFIIALKNFIMDHNLPVLERKWDKVTISKNVVVNKNNNSILEKIE